MSFEKSPSTSVLTGETDAEVEALERPSLKQTMERLSTAYVTVYENLNSSNPRQAKAEFLANPDLVHPPNEYGYLDPEAVARNLETIRQVHTDLGDSDLSDKEKRFAEIMVQDLYLRNDFLAANIAYNSAQNPEDKAAAAEYHREANEALYGKPDEKIFNSLLADKLAKINVAKLCPDDQEYYQALLRAIGPLEVGEYQRFQPKPETVARFSELVNDFYKNIFDKLPEGQETFTPEEAATIVNEILVEDFPDSDYQASVAPERVTAAVDHAERKIVFPGARVKGDYTRTDLKMILAHEFGTHVYRALPYEKDATLKAFSQELPNNEMWDEGIARCVEQAISGAPQADGIGHYINIGLANFKGKNFREVFEINSMLEFLIGAKPNETTNERVRRMQKIQNQIFNPVQRCFRGTGELPNNKDLAYFNGENMVWRYIEENIDDPELFTNLFLAGKTIAADKNQERLIYEMHVGGLE